MRTRLISNLVLGALVAAYLGASPAATAQTAAASPGASLPTSPVAPAPAAAAAPESELEGPIPAAATAPALVAETPASAPAAPVEVGAAATSAADAADASASSVPAAPASTPTAEEPLDLSQFTQSDTSSIGSDEGKLNLYGFSDFSYFLPLRRGIGITPYPTFYVGNLNLYMATDLGADFRSMVEVRFSYLPHGATPLAADGFTALPRVNNTAPDYTDLGRPLRWGGISIQRAWLEKTFHPLATVRVGHWLTPYGIWNVDHGSPVIISVRRPYIVGESFFPQSQTGIELYGSTAFGPAQVGYHLTLSNGRGPLDTYQDLDSNKAVGVRLWGKYDSDFGTFTLGTSMYRGQYADRTATYVMNESGAFDSKWLPTVKYDELSLAADFKWEWKGALFQAEGILNDVTYKTEEKLRPVVTSAYGGPNGYTPDSRRSGAYGLIGYRTDFLGTMPFFGGEFYHVGMHSFTPDAAAIWTGLNVRPTPRVVLKAVYSRSWFTNTSPFGASFESFEALDFQAAWGF
ncbi:MAG TPA: hypothetical protein VFQ61_12670 [Polyangiaceae bacterium]|nr:hypothetical protein [Polyangiaceae bacterium]